MSNPTTSGTEPTTSPQGAEGARHHRRVRNYLIDTALQLRLASYLLAVAALLSAGLCWLLWQAWQETSRVIALGAIDAADSLTGALASEDRGRLLLVAAALGGVLLCLLLAAVVITHRIAGPAFAIGRTCRQVAEGQLTRPPPLRSGDLLVELGEDVATMVEALRDRETHERDLLLAAALALRDAGDGPEVSRVAAAVQRLAGEKGERLKDQPDGAR
jgi:methyl-accepting chemotaxis protein